MGVRCFLVLKRARQRNNEQVNRDTLDDFDFDAARSECDRRHVARSEVSER
jgi:hypothetical protein